MEYEHLLYTVSDQTAIVTLNRPKAWNALCGALNTELESAIRRADGDPAVRAIVLTGGPKVFAAGADVKQMADATPMTAARTAEQGQQINELIESIGLPVIAAVNGMALGGGCELAMACDFRVAGKSAVFGQPEVGLGILPGAGGTQRLALLAGPAVGRERGLVGRQLRADEALACGLVTKVVENEATLDTALALAAELCKKPAYALAQAKYAIVTGQNFGVGCGKLFERQLFALTFSNSDQVEGMHAFLERREPRFQNQR